MKGGGKEKQAELPSRLEGAYTSVMAEYHQVTAMTTSSNHFDRYTYARSKCHLEVDSQS